ncbi:hypothetical protein MTO96_023294 [Rhipicephalus appendiculatus]
MNGRNWEASTHLRGLKRSNSSSSLSALSEMGHDVWSSDSRMSEFQLNGTEDDDPASYVFSERVNRRRRTWRMFMSMGRWGPAPRHRGDAARCWGVGFPRRSAQRLAAAAARPAGLACGDQPVMGHLRPSWPPKNAAATRRLVQKGNPRCGAWRRGTGSRMVKLVSGAKPSQTRRSYIDSNERRTELRRGQED